MFPKMLDILNGRFFFQADEGGGGAAGGASGEGSGGGGSSSGAGAGAGGEGDKSGDSKSGTITLPEGFSEDKWAKLKDVDPDRWAKVKDIDPEIFSKSKGFYDRVAGDSALFDKVNKIIEQHEATFSNPEYKRIADEMKVMRNYIEQQEAEKNERTQQELAKQFDADLAKASDEVAKELKFENVLDFDKELIKDTVLRAYQKDQVGDKKLTIKDLKNLVTESVKKIDGYRREVLKGAVREDKSPDPIKDGKTGDKKIERDLRSKDSRVEEGQKFLQESLKT